MGDIVESGIGLSYRPANILYVAWRASTTTYARANFIPPVRDYEFGYWIWSLIRIHNTDYDESLWKTWFWYTQDIVSTILRTGLN